MSDAKPTAPRHLSPSSRAFWRETVEEYELLGHHLKLLQAALESWDRMQEARAILAVDGAVYRDRFGAPRKHPAVSVEESARLAFIRAMRALDLDGTPIPESRPPRRL